MSRHLMARFRHLHAADEHGLDFDWKPYPDGDCHQAKLENGDLMYALGLHSGGWGYEIYNSPFPEENHQSIGRHGQPYPDAHSAMRAAEDHYKTLDRHGVTPPARDYDINDIMRNEGF